MPLHRRHAAIVHDRCADLLCAGLKTIETRLYRHKRLPYGRIRVGDEIFFKRSGGAIFGAADIVRIQQFEDLTPADVRRIRRQHNHAVRAEPAYWAAKCTARYAILIWLDRFRTPRTAPQIPRQYGSGWLILRSSSRRLNDLK